MPEGWILATARAGASPEESSARRSPSRPSAARPSGEAAPKLTGGVRAIALRWFDAVERRLEGREWIACDHFTVAAIMMAGVLRGVRKTDLMEPFPRLKAYDERCIARPAWQRTLGLYAERLGVRVDDIR